MFWTLVLVIHLINIDMNVNLFLVIQRNKPYSLRTPLGMFFSVHGK